MDYTAKKKQLNENFTKVVQEIDRLISMREQIRGQYAIIEEMSKEDTSVTKEGNKQGKKVEKVGNNNK